MSTSPQPLFGNPPHPRLSFEIHLYTAPLFKSTSPQPLSRGRGAKSIITRYLAPYIPELGGRGDEAKNPY